MVLSWSFIEIIRYPIYAISVLDYFRPPEFLVYLRYTAFFVLYPVGGASEAALVYATLPKIGAQWRATDFARAAYFAIQWPSAFSGFFLRIPWLTLQYQ
jgi:very-long-chain (3R)-3-hydroxyacyl-CoA dehydratase